jgi:hypothetical protein
LNELIFLKVDTKRHPTKPDPIETEILFLPSKKLKKKKRLQWKAGTQMVGTPAVRLQIII